MTRQDLTLVLVVTDTASLDRLLVQTHVCSSFVVCVALLDYSDVNVAGQVTAYTPTRWRSYMCYDIQAQLEVSLWVEGLVACKVQASHPHETSLLVQ
jgi:hypothetical protein